MSGTSAGGETEGCETAIRRLIRGVAVAVVLLLAYSRLALGEGASERNRVVVEALFAAVAGTTAEEESVLHGEMTEEEITLRDASNAMYRVRTLPWLLAALRPETANSPHQYPEPDTEAEWDPVDVYAIFGTTMVGVHYIGLMAERGYDDPESCLSGTQEACQGWLAEVDAKALAEINGDYACWIYCPDSRINYPVVRGNDNRYYLDRLFNGTTNAYGTLFIDARNLADFQDPNTLIYGHNMRDGGMFKAITYYEEQSYYEAHPYMLVQTSKENYLVELFAGYITRADDPCFDIAIGDQEDLKRFVKTAKEKSAFVADCQIGTGDRLVTLSTCAYVFEDARFVVIGKLVTIK